MGQRRRARNNLREAKILLIDWASHLKTSGKPASLFLVRFWKMENENGRLRVATIAWNRDEPK